MMLFSLLGIAYSNYRDGQQRLALTKDKGVQFTHDGKKTSITAKFTGCDSLYMVLHMGSDTYTQTH